MKKIIILIVAILLVSSGLFSQNSIYDFKVKDINGKEFDFTLLKGKKFMIVNVASKCGYTYQYKELQELFSKFGNEKFTIIGFPANNFLNQEPGSNEDIKEFCSKNYGVSFPMMSKISVKGDDIEPIYAWLTSKEANGVSDSEVKWNFQKYLINESGKIVEVISTKESPLSQKIINWINN